MNQETPDPSSPPPRNTAARASVVIALVFLSQCLVLLATILFGLSSWGSRWVEAHPDHPLAGFADLAVELSLLCFPLDLIAGAAAVILGLRGFVVARRRTEGFGRRESLIGIGLGALVLLLPVVTVFCWARAFRQ